MTSSAACVMSRALFLREFAQVAVRQRARFLQDAESADQLRRLDVVADVKVDQRPGGLCSPIAVMGNVNRTHRVRFDAMSFRRGERGCLGTHGQNLGGLKQIEKAPDQQPNFWRNRSKNIRWLSLIFFSASAKGKNSARSISGKVWIFLERGGHSISNVLVLSEIV